MPISNLLLFLYFLLSQIAPTIAKHLRERQLYIAESIKSFDLRSNEIALHYREIKEKLGRADVESEDIIQKANEIAEQTKQKIVANAKKQAARLEKDAESELDQKLRYTQQQLQLELIDAAFSKAEQLIEQHITSEDLQRFEQEYLKQVGKFS
jgi:F-type H+-transporting ATPase subunit b